MKTLLISCFAFIILGVMTTANAQVQLSGYFIARTECPVFQSIRSQTNPGNISTTVDHAYVLIAKNKDKATHYLIRINAAENQRWVAIGCGEHVVPVDGGTPIDNGDSTTGGSEDNKQERYILAVSWQPGFCETRPSKPECVSQTEDRFDASNFTLHGLWPQPRANIYCKVASNFVKTDKTKNWGNLPALELEDETRTELNQVMPGSQSNLHRHEWIKHGTCYKDPTAANDYYQDSLKLMSELNASAVRNLFADNIGKQITSTQIREAFNDSFGEGAGDKIKIACKKDGNRRLITEITIALKGRLEVLPMREAILLASNANNAGCNQGIVDPVGLQ
jgi:ribonuclease T2